MVVPNIEEEIRNQLCMPVGVSEEEIAQISSELEEKACRTLLEVLSSGETFDEFAKNVQKDLGLRGDVDED